MKFSQVSVSNQRTTSISYCPKCIHQEVISLLYYFEDHFALLSLLPLRCTLIPWYLARRSGILIVSGPKLPTSLQMGVAVFAVTDTLETAADLAARSGGKQELVQLLRAMEGGDDCCTGGATARIVRRELYRLLYQYCFLFFEQIV